MKRALYLMGGGAKGAFQAGVIYALKERGMEWDVISGTSIGAINGYLLYKEELDLMKEMYLKSFGEEFMDRIIEGKTVDNSFAGEILKTIKDKKAGNIQNFYVNYMPVSDGKVFERTEDITKLSLDDAIERILWSSRLPYNNPPMSFKEFIEYLKENEVEGKFQNDLRNHVYDGINLDGGFYNNILIREVLNHNPQSLMVLGYRGTKEAYLEKLGKDSDRIKDILIYISSDKGFELTDTYRFEPEFLEERFQEGYLKGRKADV